MNQQESHKAGKGVFPYGAACFLLLAVLFVLTACESQATPFPVDLPAEPTATPQPSVAPPIRYMLDVNTLGFVADMELIEASAQVETLTEAINPSELGGRYDVVAAYGEWSGWTRSPVIPHVALVVNGNAPPLGTPVLAEIARHSLNAQTIASELNIPGVIADQLPTDAPQALRAELANMGYPDGLRLTLAYAYTPGVVQVAHQLHGSGIEIEVLLMTEANIQSALSDRWLHLALIAWMAPEQRAAWVALVGEANVLDLYILPISYQALPELTISFTPSGWPIARR